MKANQKTKSEFIEAVNDFGVFNNWKGFIGFYFTKAEVRQMKKYGVTENHTIKEAYDILSKQEDEVMKTSNVKVGDLIKFFSTTDLKTYVLPVKYIDGKFGISAYDKNTNTLFPEWCMMDIEVLSNDK